MSTAGVVAQIGQVLCRRALQEMLAFGLLIGVHCGQRQSIQLPNSQGRRSYFGEVCAEALRLALTTGQRLRVHFPRKAKEKLQALCSVRLTISGGGAYYLDPATQARSMLSFTLSSTAPEKLWRMASRLGPSPETGTLERNRCSPTWRALMP